MARSLHIPVLVKEVLEYLNVQRDHWYIDATLGGGGHAREIMQAGGKVIGIDQDQSAIKQAKEFFRSLKVEEEKRIIFVHGKFGNLAGILNQLNVEKVAGVLFDLGLSSDQLADASRGFSFQLEGPLDMRMDTTETVLAKDLINGLSQKELVKLFGKFGEIGYERAQKIAQAIVTERVEGSVETTVSLKKLIEQIYQQDRGYQKKIHPATQVFQALRIAVNDELNQLQQGLKQVTKYLMPGGRLIVICFHSLEDRIVKEFLRESTELNVLTQKPITSSAKEVEENIRSRSAKLRAAEKT